jgi:predicted PurR-regulated permease PerM
MGLRFKILLSAFLILGSLFFLFFGLVQGKSFLIPIVTAAILAMLMNPVAHKMMKWGMGRVWAVLVSDLVVVLFIAFMIFLLVAQANQVAQNWSQIEKTLQPKIEQVQNFYDEKLKGSVGKFKQNNNSSSQNQQSDASNDQQQDDKKSEGQNQNQSEQESSEQMQQQGNDKSGQQQEQSESQSQQNSQTDNQQGQKNQDSGFGSESIRKALTGIVSDIFSFISTLLLILVYIFFFMFYQKKFENALIGLFPDKKREQARSIIKESSKVAQKYLLGRFILIAILAGLYMIAFTIAGIEYAIFISLLAALFSLLPYIGNIIGYGLALGMSFISGGETGQLVGLTISFVIIQFIESYLLEPYVIGDKVDLNPVAIIVGVVLGNLVWGIMGMLLVIPVLGIIKVVFDNIESLRPLGYVLDERDVSDDEDEGVHEKIKKWVRKKIGK